MFPGKRFVFEITEIITPEITKEQPSSPTLSDSGIKDRDSYKTSFY
jgi:hypothetical protein